MAKAAWAGGCLGGTYWPPGRSSSHVLLGPTLGFRPQWRFREVTHRAVATALTWPDSPLQASKGHSGPRASLWPEVCQVPGGHVAAEGWSSPVPRAMGGGTWGPTCLLDDEAKESQVRKLASPPLPPTSRTDTDSHALTSCCPRLAVERRHRSSARLASLAGSQAVTHDLWLLLGTSGG